MQEEYYAWKGGDSDLLRARFIKGVSGFVRKDNEEEYEAVLSDEKNEFWDTTVYGKPITKEEYFA
jgi:hypothetical protein